ncbi:MAG TPA: glycosyltransferase family 1 protein [Anaerolineales bacterium]|nr:glycosyltransferase family 1 protein [Anaerolineales bacterium]
MRLGLDVRLTYYTSGGISKYIRHLAADLPALSPQHEHIHLYRRGHAETFSPRARRVDCWTPAHHRLEAFALAVEAAPHRLDLLHSPDFIPPLGGCRRSIITVHDLTFLLHPEFLTAESRRYYNGQIRRAVRQANAISADSQATKDDLVNLLSVPPEKITVIHLGHDPEFHPLAAEAVSSVLARLDLSPGYILFVGTFEPRKNVPGLLHAYAQLLRLLPDAPPLVPVGHRGWLFDEAASLVRDLGLEAHVRRLESLPAADLPAVYNGASVFVLPSHYEGFGFPVLEAMGCGVPCVIADRASLPEIAGEAALKVDPASPDDIAEALRRALTDSALREAMRQKGFDQVKKFTWEKTARATLALYERVGKS